MIVKENIEFERGQDPKKSLKIGKNRHKMFLHLGFNFKDEGLNEFKEIFEKEFNLTPSNSNWCDQKVSIYDIPKMIEFLIEVGHIPEENFELHFYYRGNI